METFYSPIEVNRKIVEFVDSGQRFVVALVMKVDGSVPQITGAKAVIDETGRIWGTVGGGRVEATAQRQAVEACETHRPIVFDIEMDNAYPGGTGSICGGRMRILVDPTAATYRECYEQAAEALERRERGVLLTKVCSALEPEVSVQWFEEEAVGKTGFPGADIVSSCLAHETPRFFAETTDTSTEVLVEPVIPQPALVIVGGGHVGQAIARQAILVGFDITIIDDRPEFTSPALFPEGVTTLCGEIRDEVAKFPVGEDTYIVIVTRGHKHDADALEACIHAPAMYIGMMGSKRKVVLVRKHFIDSGIATEQEFARVFAPIGLDTGGVTVPEIAASIIAQLTIVRRRGTDFARDGKLAFR